ncbi:hypothetical protein D352_00522 [Enterococcus faecium LA4B-2]|nr:hypothetical protein D352_00522 [Enterococcus faecium LA4B-2]
MLFLLTGVFATIFPFYSSFIDSPLKLLSIKNCINDNSIYISHTAF